MAGDEIDMKEWGVFTQMVTNLMTGFTEMRGEFKELQKSVGRRCTDCAPGESLKDVKVRLDKVDDRLRFLEIKVAGIAVLSSVVSAGIMHLLAKAFR
jgi:hypothetical protein